MYGLVTRVPLETDADLYPTIPTHKSDTEAGKMGLVELFSTLVETLEPVEA